MKSCKMAVEVFKMVGERGLLSGILSEAHKRYLKGEYEHALMLYTIAAEEVYIINLII